MSPRFFRHGELPLVLLALLAERPRHGYDVLAELARLFGPAYRPSPGRVYPAVEALAAEGLIEGEPSGARTTYRITAEGERALRDREEILAELELRTGARLADGDTLETVLNRFRARVAALSGRVDPDAVSAVLDRAGTEIENLEQPPLKEAR